MDSTFSIINKTYEMYKSTIELNNALNKRMRYSLGSELERNILVLLENLIFAKNAAKTLKTPYLTKSSALLEIIMLKLRLFLELKLANETKIFKMQEDLKEIGRMLGGWLKSVKST